MTDSPMRKFLEKAMKIDFGTMRDDDWTDFVNGLPRDEFIAMMSLPKDGSTYFQPCDGDMPCPPQHRIFVTYEDGSVDGPNRADSFIWGETHPDTRIVAVAPHAK